ncbi:sigma factor-like helix-turn-helix DNA-binding protein [Amycolatopsis nigrescens]|uniref:sigma factor-like helix-turn-helix DNA-binding protein n=1 Tax=Amycolatopsis nigrescens TaxID=381445 RepID=UPI0007C477CF|nr:sigma factor-like helix-turn-helix DNA-binding protein [Amycolatopsis nigrescens]
MADITRTDTDTAAHLMRDAAAGDSRATHALLAVVRPIALRYCRARLGDRGRLAPDELAAEVCVAVLAALPGHAERGGSVLSLVYAIVSRRVTEVLGRGSGWCAPAVGRLGPLLDRLPRLQQEIIILRVAVGLSAGATAEMLGLTLETVRLVQHRALDRMRAN